MRAMAGWFKRLGQANSWAQTGAFLLSLGVGGWFARFIGVSWPFATVAAVGAGFLGVAALLRHQRERLVVEFRGAMWGTLHGTESRYVEQGAMSVAVEALVTNRYPEPVNLQAELVFSPPDGEPASRFRVHAEEKLVQPIPFGPRFPGVLHVEGRTSVEGHFDFIVDRAQVQRMGAGDIIGLRLVLELHELQRRLTVGVSLHGGKA